MGVSLVAELKGREVGIRMLASGSQNLIKPLHSYRLKHSISCTSKKPISEVVSEVPTKLKLTCDPDNARDDRPSG